MDGSKVFNISNRMIEFEDASQGEECQRFGIV